MPGTMPLACIIVHYGAPETTRDCVASLLSGTATPCIIIASNTDEEETQKLRAVLSGAEATILAMGRNSGFAAACNAGLRHARQRPEIRHAWLLNNDAVVAPDAAHLLLNCLEKHSGSIIGTSVFRRDRPDRLELALGCRFSPLTTRLTSCSPTAKPEDVIATPKVDYVYGASMAFPLALVDEIGLLDERFFLYYEEHDFCLRAREAGYTFHWCREAAVWHGRKHISLSRDKQARAFKHFHETRSTMLFLRKHHQRLLPLALGLRTMGKLISLPLRGESYLLQSFLQGLKSAGDFLIRH